MNKKQLESAIKLHRILSESRNPLSRQTLEKKLECNSRSTFVRVRDILRDIFGAPIEYNYQKRGYHYSLKAGETFEIPGLWFTAKEIHALLAAEQILSSVQDGLLKEQIAPITMRLKKILREKAPSDADISTRVRIIQIAARSTEPKSFQKIASALLARKRLSIQYHGRSSDEKSEREISPQRLMYYRSNWYVDAYCHSKKDIRSFALERITQAKILGKKAQEVSKQRLTKELESTYGIFSGPEKHNAVLVFSAQRARWIAEEEWHPKQQGKFLDDGRYELRIPYSDPRELILDIQKYGADVEVIAPKELRDEVVDRLRRAVGVYETKGKSKR